MVIRTVLVASLLAFCGVAEARQVKSIGKIKTANETPIDPAAARKAIEAVGQDFVIALKKKDVKAIGEMFETDAVYFPSGADAVHGRDAIVKYLTGVLADRTIDEASLVTQEVSIVAHTAIESGVYTRTVRIGNAPAVSDHGKYLVVWQYDDDKKWRILRDMANTSVPPQPQH
jgi:uncharacterized protein (TIGR02246 family)